MKNKQLLIALSIVGLCIGCNADPKIQAAGSPSNQSMSSASAKLSPTEVKSQMASLQLEVHSLIADKTCNNNSDCETMGFGVKPCGGPWKYLVFSKIMTDEKVLKQKVDSYNLLEHQGNQRSGLMSNCMMTARPSVSCNSKICSVGKPTFSK